jgi:hypothetical protein
MSVKFKFLIGYVDWSQYGGKWISQKFNNGSADFWLVREIINWEEQDSDTSDGKYTVTLSSVYPDNYSLDNRASALRSCFNDNVKWDELSEEQRVEALHGYGGGTVEKHWHGNNFSLLFKECQTLANMLVEGCEIPPPVDFSKLPESILVVVEKNWRGHLEINPKSDRLTNIIAATNVESQFIAYVQNESRIEEFVERYISASKQKELNEGLAVTCRIPFVFYTAYLPPFTDDYIEYRQQQKERSHPQSLPSLFAEINGIPIYHVHKDGYGIGRELDFCYSTAQSPEDLHYECRFRVDELDPECRVKPIGDEPPIESWNRFQEHCKRAIAQALRENKLKLAPAPDAAVLGGGQQPRSWDVVLGGQSNH